MNFDETNYFRSGVAAVQRSDGSFSASIEGNEYDMRFVYCACCICFMLNDWGSVDKAQMGEYILNSIVSIYQLQTGSIVIIPF